MTHCYLTNYSSKFKQGRKQQRICDPYYLLASAVLAVCVGAHCVVFSHM